MGGVRNRLAIIRLVDGVSPVLVIQALAEERLTGACPLIIAVDVRPLDHENLVRVRLVGHFLRVVHSLLIHLTVCDTSIGVIQVATTFGHGRICHVDTACLIVSIDRKTRVRQHNIVVSGRSDILLNGSLWVQLLPRLSNLSRHLHLSRGVVGLDSFQVLAEVEPLSFLIALRPVLQFIQAGSGRSYY